MRVQRNWAFSLVEVVIAIGVVGFAMAGVIGLLAAMASAVNTTREYDSARVAAQIAQGLVRARNFSEVVPSKLVSPGQVASDANTVFVSVDLRISGWGEEVPNEQRFYVIAFETADSATGPAPNPFYAPVVLRIEWPWAAEANTRSVRRVNEVLLR